MTRIHLHVELHAVKVFLRWLQARYLHKLERYQATHQPTYFH